QSRMQAINVINQEATRLERIVDDMLSVAEIESGEMKLRHDDVRMDELLTHMRADFQAQADEKQIQLVFDLSPKLPVIQADRDKIGLVLINVIGNALKYTPQKGKVTVIVDVTDDEQRIVFDVRDTGIGIDSGEIERIFDKFYRANDRRVAKIVGTGLGLALTRAVVQQHGGGIAIESELDKGSRFVITLPTNVAPA
ncbi:MAG: HAMP domain-containing sensor histidine kinase, partial [Phycisphaeraceae bacterium]|nr:HAMP domain-containing sensor histidine kinase [Phycisphaeraceae bacterium]